ncbi:MAG: hypothetical protein GY930_21510, partial [bacterium]|nr:hypothetical protein [bacterium]
ADLIELLRFTVADRESFPRGLAWPQLKPTPKDPMRTARHTRGYKGTKAQPPKQPTHKPFDVLPYLDGGAHEMGVLDALSVHGQPTGGAEGDWTGENRAAAAQMPEHFHRNFMWMAEEFPWERIARMIPLYWNLGLAEDSALGRLVALIFHGPGLFHRLRWVEATVLLPPERRIAFVELLLELEVKPDPEGDLSALVSRLDQLCTDQDFRNRAHHMLAGWESEATAWEVLAQVELLSELYPQGSLADVEPVGGAAKIVRETMAQLERKEEEWESTGYCLYLLEGCGDFEGFAELLAQAPLESMGSHLGYEYLRLFTSLLCFDCDWEARQDKWDWMKGQAAEWAGLVLRVDSRHRFKMMNYLYELIWEWDSPKELEDRMRPMVQWAFRLCGPEFSGRVAGAFTLCRLAYLPLSVLPQALEAPDSAFRHLEKASRRDNDDRLAGDGLRVLVSAIPDLVVSGLKAGTGALATTARLFGSLRKGDAARTVRELAKGALFHADPESLSTEDLVRLLQEQGPPKAQALISRNVRQHLEGTRPLTAAQVERVGCTIRGAWSDILLGSLAHKVPQILAERVGASTSEFSTKENHALRMIFAAQDNRRMLRKVLKHHFAGDRDYIQNHALNRDWLERHPKIRDSAWCQGFEISRQSAKKGWLTISLETDPLEVLRLGTHVGTCYGLGGGFAHSAAAIMMDGNKHVAYCRDARGVVLARQVLAMTRDERLCCFGVYPWEGSEEFQGFFAEFDQAFAAALGFPMYDPEADDSEDAEEQIEFLLSSAWWWDHPI